MTVHAGDDLQQALNKAQPGDELVLDAGATFTGSFVLPNKGPDPRWIAIRSSRMNSLPGEGKRVNPTHAWAMPKLVTRNASPALTTAPGAHHYRIMGLEIAVAAKVPLNYATVYLGDGKTLDALPTDIVFDRVYIHGSVLCNCKQGIILNSRRTAVIDSYISEYHSADQDTQAILGYNGPGPFKIVNNHLEAACENVMFGGAVPGIPGLVPSDIEFRRNYLYKPVRWRSSIIPKPPPPSVAAAAGGELLSGQTYYYKLVAAGPAGYESGMLSDPSDEAAVLLPGDRNAAVLSWPPVTYGDWTDSRAATEYLVFRTSDPPTAAARRWTSLKVPASARLSFTDTGAPGMPGPPRPGRAWLVKNLFELKNAQRVLVDGNVMEHCWAHGQSGHAILAFPRTEAGAASWAVTQDLTISNNVIRHAGRGMTLGGVDDYCSGRAVECVRSSRVLVENNLLDDIGPEWGGTGWAFMLLNMDGAVIRRNTVVNRGSVSVWLAGINSGLLVDSNIVLGGITGDGSIGMGALARYAPGAVVSRNVLVGQGTSARNYDSSGGNVFPATWNDLQFLDLDHGDYRLAASSPFKNTGSGGRDPGASLDQIQAATVGVDTRMKATAQPVIAGVWNAAAMSEGAVAPGSLMTVLAEGFSGDTMRATSDPLPSELGSVSVLLNDRPAPLLSVSPGEITAQVPYEAPPGPAAVAVAVGRYTSAPFSITVAEAAPEMFLADAGRAVAFNADSMPNSAANPAARGSICAIYLTGQGAVEPGVATGALAPPGPLSIPVLPVKANLGGQDATVIFAGLTPGTAGLFQVNLLVPDLSSGDYPLIVSVGPASSKPGLVSIH